MKIPNYTDNRSVRTVKHSSITQKTLMIAAFSVISSCALANDTTNVHQQIHQHVLETVKNKLEDIFPIGEISIHLNEVNPNINIDQCEKELIVSLPDTMRERFSASVRCTDEDNTWKLHVRGSAEVVMPVIALSEGLSRGETITEDSISFTDSNVLGENGDYFTHINDVVGTQVRRSVSAGTVLTDHMVSLPIIIERNDIIDVEMDRQTFSISFKAIALEDARKGEKMRAKNEQSNKIITVIAKEKGKAVAL